MTLPPPYYPFPLHNDHTIRADMYPLGMVLNGRQESNHFEVDQQYVDYIEQKLHILKQHEDQHHCIDLSEQRQLTHALENIWKQFQQEHPTIANGDYLPARLSAEIKHWLKRQQNPTIRLANHIALHMQEDLVLMHQGYAEWIHVCFPSNWRPVEKFGLDFSQIHQPIPEGNQLLKASDNVVKAMTYKKAYVRFGWILSNNSYRNQHPDTVKPSLTYKHSQDLLNQLWLRMERQTTYPMPDLNRSLFTIRIYQQPLLDALNTPEKQVRFTGIIRTLSPALAVYKGLDTIYAPLLEGLESLR